MEQNPLNLRYDKQTLKGSSAQLLLGNGFVNTWLKPPEPFVKCKTFCLCQMAFVGRKSMNNLCPRECKSQLLMTERFGVEIDYCPTCRGVWLDRGELDKIIEKAEESMKASSPGTISKPVEQFRPQSDQMNRTSSSQRRDYDDDDDDKKFHHGNTGYGYKKKKKSWIGEIFDFD